MFGSCYRNEDARDGRGGAATNTVVSFRDGGTKATYLNGVLKTTETREPFAETDYEGSRGVSSPRWKRTESDFLGRTVSESRPGYGGSTLVTSNAYDVAGRLASTLSLSTRSTRLNAQLYLYDNLNDRVAAVDDRNFNSIIDWTGPDLVSSNSTHYVKLDGYWWRETKSYSIHDDNSAVARLMGVRLSRVTGLGANGLASETISIDLRGNATTNRTYRNRAAAEEVAWTRYPTSSTPAVAVSTNGLVRSSTSQTGVTTTYSYDALERETSVTDGRGNTTRTVYDVQGRISLAIDALGHSTAYGYDALGRQVSVTDPLTNTVVTAYDVEGRVVSQRGATYPVDYAYDEYGNKISMTTYRDESLAQGDTTRWLYDEPSGCMTNKVYADGKGPTYTYTPDGKLATRTWARGIVTTYSYDSNGTLTNTVYSDDTPTVSLAYNRAGRQIQALDAAGVTTFLYDDFGALTNETVVGVAGTNTIERFYDTFGRDAGYALNGVRQSTLGYDAVTGRLASMQIPSIEESNHLSPTPTLNSNSFQWTYLAGSDIKSSLAYPNGLTASWTYGNRGELLEVRNARTVSSSPSMTSNNLEVVSQYAYTYDAAGRRISCAHSGAAFDTPDTNSYLYNTRSELTNATATVDATYSYGYNFDDIGNRKTSAERGTNVTYAVNHLNQYTEISNSTVQPSASNLQPLYDADGNQTLVKTATGIWQVTYNGENRPVRWENGDSVITMSYDRMGRRVTKNDQRFVYNGYLQIANHHSSTSTSHFNYYIWDPTEPVATRPLAWNFSTSQPSTSQLLFYTHDGNKNVSEVIASNNDIAAHYEYAPFGALTVSRGVSAAANPWRFSSEYAEDDTATVYYNYRHYEPVTGRWMERDPIEEDGGLCLYGYNGLDRFGLVSFTIGGDGDEKGTQYRGVISGPGYAFDWGLSWSLTGEYDKRDDCSYFLSATFSLGAEAGLTAGFAGMYNLMGYDVWLLGGVRGFVGVEASTKFSAEISPCSSAWGAGVSVGGYLGVEGGAMARYSKRGAYKWKEVGFGARVKAKFGTNADLVCGGDNCTIDGILGLQPLEGEIFGRFYFVSVSKDFSGWLNKRVDTSKFRKEYHFEFKNPLAR